MNDPLGPQEPVEGDTGELPTVQRVGAGADAGSARDYGRGRYPETSVVLHDQDGYDDFLDDDERPREFVRIPRRAPQLPSFFGWRLVVKLAVLIGLIMGGLWVYHQVNPAGEPGDAVVVDVPDGANVKTIAEVLDDAGVISNARLFQEYARFKSGNLIKAGTYQMNKDMALWEALSVLEAGPVPIDSVSVTVPEGLRLGEILATLAEVLPNSTTDSLTAAAASGEVASRYQPAGGTLEGLLFPDTYQLDKGATDAENLTVLAKQFEAVADELQLDSRAAAIGYTPYQIITIASMIEEEAKVDDERPKIARVIYNRLASGVRLDIDATTLYAVGKEGNTLTLSDLDSDSPYNTRKAVGLPPGPISAPGRASLEAALAPAEGDWFYYVLADADGHHAFTADPAEFDALVAQAEEKGLLG